MSRASPPPRFDEEFLSWFREETEAAWDEYRPRTFDQYVAGRVGGHDWQAGTRWTCDLVARDIDELERRWGVAFPADYCLFLRNLHATDRPRTGALYRGGYELVPAVGPGVYHWLRDQSAMRAALEDVVQGLVFDVENNVLWPDEWGRRPSQRGEREQVVREQVAAAPKLAPIFMHRALVIEPARPGNPVLSIHQSDIIVYGGDLRSYLLTEFAALLPPGSKPTPDPNGGGHAVPFWLDL